MSKADSMGADRLLARARYYSAPAALLLALAALSPARAERPLEEILTDFNSRNLQTYMAAESDLAGRGLEILPDILRTAKQRQRVQRLVGKLGPRALPRLLELMRQDEFRVSAGGILFTLAEDSDAAMAPDLLECMRDNPKGRRTCGMALVKVMGPKAEAQTGLLVAALADADPEIRTYAAAGLGQIGPRAAKAVPALVERLRDSQDSVRAAAARSLGLIGKRAVGAKAALRMALRDSSEEVRETARQALEAIHG